MKILKNTLLFLAGALFTLFVGLNIWGYLTLGTLQPAPDAVRDDSANAVVMILGGTGSAGGGLIDAAVADPEVEQVYIVARRSTPVVEAALASGKAELILHQDFTDYTALEPILANVNTVLWALGTSSLQVDEATYTRIHVDFPLAFVQAWLAARQQGPMSFHFIAGMGTDSDAQWARDKRKTEQETARMGAAVGMRSFSYRSGYIRPADIQSGAPQRTLEWLLKPGGMAISSQDLGAAMLEISARTEELPNGTLLDNADSIAYAEAYNARRGG